MCLKRDTFIIHYFTVKHLRQQFSGSSYQVVTHLASPYWNLNSGNWTSHKDDSVTALAVDWVTSNLYWSSIKRPDLHLTSHHDGFTTSLLHGSLKVKVSLIIVLFCSSIVTFTSDINMAPLSLHTCLINYSGCFFWLSYNRCISQAQIISKSRPLCNKAVCCIHVCAFTPEFFFCSFSWLSCICFSW